MDYDRIGTVVSKDAAQELMSSFALKATSSSVDPVRAIRYYVLSRFPGVSKYIPSFSGKKQISNTRDPI